ncbi:tail fiber protein [Pseudomonas phage WP1]
MVRPDGFQNDPPHGNHRRSTCPSTDVVDQINQLLLDRDTLYKVITRGMVFERMTLLPAKRSIRLRT